MRDRYIIKNLGRRDEFKPHYGELGRTNWSKRFGPQYCEWALTLGSRVGLRLSDY